MFSKKSLFTFLTSWALLVPTFASSNDALRGSRFLSLSKNMRVNIIQDLANQVEEEYSLWVVKKVNMGIDGEKLFQDALTIENSIDNPSREPLQEAKANLDFYDRARKLIASFQDTHFKLRTTNTLPYISNGIHLKKVGSKMIISGIDHKTLSFRDFLVYGQNEELKVSDEVLEIDGKPFDESITPLLPYIASSSPKNTELRAVAHLTKRNYRYPERNYTDYTIKRKLPENKIKVFQVRLPWHFEATANKRDAIFYLKEKGFHALNDLKMVYDEQEMKWVDMSSLNYRGFSWKESPRNVFEMKTYYRDGTKTSAMRTGYLFKNGKAYGYLQLFTYSAHTMQDEDGNRVPFLAPVKAFIKKLKREQVPLIIDLRYNTGGYSGYGFDILSYIARPNSIYPARTEARRITTLVRQLYDEFVWPEAINPPYMQDYNRKLLMEDMIYEAIDAGRTHTYVMTTSKDIVTDEEIGGYEQPVVALITPLCVSACDVQSTVFQKSGRVKLIGTHSNGTGAGFMGSKSLPVIPATDRYRVLRTRIPNYLFGFPVEAGVYKYQGEEMVFETNSENRPVIADIQYDFTKSDFLNHSSGWIEKAVEEIEKIRTEESTSTEQQL